MDYFNEMEDLSDFEDDNYGGMFITQSSNEDRVVSLEDADGNKCILDPKYSDISDAEEEAMEKRLR